MSKTYVISDLHLGHENLAIHRGFASAREQDNMILLNWNLLVTKYDKVLILGDVAMNKKFYPFLDNLNGNKHVILGNHDLPKYTNELLKHVKTVCGMFQKSGHILTHCPIHESQFDRFTKNIHGHLHENNIDDDRYVNVCCEQLDYTPMLLSDIIVKEATHDDN
jgi:calcineurin-like phosphoesterase family protein